MTGAAAAIETESLTKTFRSLLTRRSVEAVRGISLRVERGTTFGLLGPNGAGKTTFVKMLLSAVHPTSGSARVFGEACGKPAARRPVGYLPENHRFPTYLTAQGMLDFYGALSGMTGAERKRRIPEMLELVGLADWRRMRLGKYSKGMLQRVGLAQAMLHKPRLLILDEPSDGVDPIGRRQIRDILRSLENDGVTIFLNSHLLQEVELFCRDVAIIHKGQLALTGNVRELTAGTGYRVSAASVPDALVTELRGSVDDGQAHFTFASRPDANAAIDLLRANQCEVDSVMRMKSTLEDVFVRTVESQ